MQAEKMRRDWDVRAERNPLYYTFAAYGFDFGDFETYFRDGARDAQVLIGPVLTRFGFDPRGKSLLEIGAGCGRLFGGFAALGFAELIGLDISEKMVRLGERLCPVSEARFLVGSGEDLAGLPDASVDFCFSYNVLGHVPSVDTQLRYLDETMRVLRPGGVFQHHFRARHSRRQQLTRLVPERARPFARSLYRRATLRAPDEVGADLLRDTLLGAPISRGRVEERMALQGVEDADILEDPSYPRGTMYFAVGRRR